MMRLFTIRLRMMGAIAVVLLLLSLLGGAGMWGMFRIHGMSQDFIAHSYRVAGVITNLRVELAQVRQVEKDMIIQYEKPEAVKQLKSRWLDSLQRVDQLVQKVREIDDRADPTQLNTLTAKLKDYREQLASVVRQLENSGYESATVANRMSARAVASFDEAEKTALAIEKGLFDQAERMIRDQAHVSDQTQWLFVAAVLITIVVVVPLTLLNMVSICRPIEQAQGEAQAIAGGDLSRSIAVDGRDEVSQLQRALLDMQQGLGAMVSRVRDVSESIATASQEIASGNQDLSGRTEQTASNVQQTVSSISDLTGNVQQTATSAQLANQMAASASTSAQRGGSVVQQAVASMHEISSASRKIGDILGLIDSIAFQTNILALNAAVEAARAGEAGRGFAVVASEVRALAQRSAQAASEIKHLIENTVHAVDGGVRLVEDAGLAMNEITTGVQRVTDIIGEISAAASEQSTGIANVSNSLSEIDRMTQQNAALVEESAAAAESLREQAANLAGVVHQFRLASAPGGSSHWQVASRAVGALPAAPAGTSLPRLN